MPEEESELEFLDREEAERAYLLRSNQTIERMLEGGIIDVRQAEEARTREFDFAHDLLFTTPESRGELDGSRQTL